MNITFEYIPAKVGMMSLIGPGRERPTTWGNYFWFAKGPSGSWEDGYRCVNFWAENLNTLVERGVLQDGLVKVKVYDKKWALVLDDRIPENWYHYSLCFTGCYRPSLEIIKDMFATRGDPENHQEEFTDPVAFHAKHGRVYKDLGNGVCSIGYKEKLL